MTSVAPPSCVTCGAALGGPYCAHCGEQAPSHNYSLAHFTEEAVEHVFHLDGRLGRSVRSLLTRPGELPAHFMAGRRKPYMGPVHLFLLANILYFLLQPFSGFVPFTTTLDVQMHRLRWSGLVQRMVEAKVAARHTTLDEYREVYDHTAHLQGKSLIMIIVPAFALVVWALYRRSDRFYVAHLVFSFYASAALLLFLGVKTVLDTQLLTWASRHGFRWLDDGNVVEAVTSLTSILPFTVYLYYAARRAYGTARRTTMWKSAVLTISFVAVLMAYRFVLFFTSFYAT